MSDRPWLQQALALAALGEGCTSPNPLVGCVIVKNGAAVGRGYHRKPGSPHAEVVALEEAGADAAGATMYVNLEPCAHQGRTGPCTEAIQRGGIARVVAATRDPNPLVDGRGFAALTHAGIRVETGLLEREARALNAPFLSTHERHRPWITLKAAQSQDGRIAGPLGSATWITGPSARRYAHRLRLRHDAVLVGAETVRRDDPKLTVRLPGVVATRTRVVLAPRLGVAPGAQVFAPDEPGAPRARVYAAADASGGDVQAFDGIAEVVRVPHSASGLDLPAVLADLTACGIQSVLVEGGGKTAGRFLAAGLVDEIVLFVAPRLLGSVGTTPVIDADAGGQPGARWRIEWTSTIPLGDDLVFVGRPGAE